MKRGPRLALHARNASLAASRLQGFFQGLTLHLSQGHRGEGGEHFM